MIKFKIKELLLAAGKPNPGRWLTTHCDFNAGKAYKFVNGKQKSITLEDISKLCENLNCTPNDLLYWEQTKSHTLPQGHPCITQLTAPNANDDWFTIFKKLTPDKVLELHQVALDKLNEK